MYSMYVRCNYKLTLRSELFFFLISTQLIITFLSHSTGILELFSIYFVLLNVIT